jgi:hypothetical protein
VIVQLAFDVGRLDDPRHFSENWIVCQLLTHEGGK